MEDIVYKIGIALTPGINATIVRALEDSEISLSEFFELPMHTLSEQLGAGPSLHLEQIARQEALHRARNEWEFIKKYNIRGIFLSDDQYPPLLAELIDAPVMLFVLGNANLSPKHAIAIVGTRKATNYGLNFVTNLCKDLALYYPDIAIVSGLALGIDSAAHNGALDNNLSTIAVVAHGLDMVYPAQNRELSRRIIQQEGAIISEYPSGVRPFRSNFLERNRIVAGLCPITFVAESEIKGGAMNTANTAFHNNREVLALPGRVSDIISSGCNHLIQQQKARIMTGTPDIALATGWPPNTMTHVPKQKNLFPELEGLTKQIYDLMRHLSDPVTPDQLCAQLNIKMHILIPTLSDMEFDGIIYRMPGARYQLS